LAFTRYYFTSSRLCTRQSSFHSSGAPALPTLLQYYCTAIGQYTTPHRSLFCMPYTIQYWSWQYRNNHGILFIFRQLSEYNRLAWPHRRRELASGSVRYAVCGRTERRRPPGSKRCESKVRMVQESFLIAVAALKTPTRHGYNEGVIKTTIVPWSRFRARPFRRRAPGLSRLSPKKTTAFCSDVASYFEYKPNSTLCRDGGNTFTQERYRSELNSAH